MTLDTSAFIGKFVEEARDRLKALGAALLRLEQAPGSVDAIAEALREAHSIKGSALMLGLTDIAQLSHTLEDLFVAAKTTPSILHGEAFDVIFASVDRIALRVEQLARGEMDAIEVADTCDKLTALLDNRGREGFSVEAVENPSRPLLSRPLSTSAHATPRSPEVRQTLRVPVEKLD